MHLHVTFLYKVQQTKISVTNNFHKNTASPQKYSPTKYSTLDSLSS